MFVLSLILRFLITYIVIQSLMLGLVFAITIAYAALTSNELPEIVSRILFPAVIVLSSVLAIIATMNMK